MTLGHALILDRLGNAFAQPELPAAVHFDDVVACAMVCSRPWRAAARLVGSPWAAIWLRWHFFRRARRAFMDVVAMRRWHSITWSAPRAETIVKETGPKRGAEYLGMLAVSARTVLHTAAADVLDLEITRLQWDLLIAAEQSGIVVIQGKDTPSVVSLAKQALEEQRAEMAKKEEEKANG